MTTLLYIMTITLGLGVVIGVWILVVVVLFILYKQNKVYDKVPMAKELQNKVRETDKKGNELLEEYIRMLKEREENNISKERDAELRKYAEDKMKSVPAGGIMSNNGYNSDEKPIHVREKMLVPYGMNDVERAILEEFYN